MNVAIIGCGLRGSLAAALLACSGIEQLSLVDGAAVEEADIGAHPLQFTPDLRAGKADALVAKLGLIEPKVHALPFPAPLTADNAAAILTGADCVLDCTDDPAVAEWIREGAVALDIPVIAPPEGFDAALVSRAHAAAVAALQADLVALLTESEVPIAGGRVLHADTL